MTIATNITCTECKQVTRVEFGDDEAIPTICHTCQTAAVPLVHKAPPAPDVWNMTLVSATRKHKYLN